MSEFVLIDRRLFLRRFGRGTVAVAMLAACGDGTQGTTASLASASTSGRSETKAPTTAATSPATTSAGGPAPAGSVHRVVLGSVSAYLVARGSEAAVVDTGNPGSAEAIATALGEIGLGWEAVGHVILTHRHGDHIGSLADVMNAAAGATGYAGAEDLPSMSSPRELVAVADGDLVFGLQVIATPGHTAGHICVLDESASALIAGDALNGSSGGVAGANPRFSDDMAVANDSVRKLAGLTFEAAYFGHGDPVLTGASGQVAALAESLTSG
jgi:glyoxylase-like metal-dependent hydrolase (beta-lactamase superfamily II)